MPSQSTKKNRAGAAADLQLRFGDFTETRYAEFVRDTALHYAFEPFGTRKRVPHVLWRHDVDFSMHRALKLAQVESGLGVSATYFIMLSGRFYNVLEPQVARIVRQLVALGHHIGLHFDCSAYADSCERQSLEQRILWERGILENVADTAVDAISFHNPTDFPDAIMRRNSIAGLINAYGDSLQSRYKYCSDSNGYWRHERIFDVLASRTHSRVQVLTHPAWWVPHPMAPRDRILRCIKGRASATIRSYDGALVASGRENVGK